MLAFDRSLMSLAGIFGMSTALWMLQDGGYDVTVLDKCGILPAPDAASTGASCSRTWLGR